MPGNPDVKDLVARAVKVTGAQDKLRQAMAEVAQQVASQPPAVPAETKPA